MNQKFCFGVLITLIGFAFSFLCFFYAVYHPCIYNGTMGLLAAFLGNDILLPFLAGTVVMMGGLTVCGVEAFRKK